VCDGVKEEKRGKGKERREERERKSWCCTVGDPREGEGRRRKEEKWGGGEMRVTGVRERLGPKGEEMKKKRKDKVTRGKLWVDMKR
jgi:hypothetical protein